MSHVTHNCHITWLTLKYINVTNRATDCLSVSWEGKQNRDARCQFFIGGIGSCTHFMVQKMFILVYHLLGSIIWWHLEYSSHTSTLFFFFFFGKGIIFTKPTKMSHTENLRSRIEKQLTTQIRLQKRQYKGRGNALPDLMISSSSSILCKLMGHWIETST